MVSSTTTCLTPILVLLHRKVRDQHHTVVWYWYGWSTRTGVVRVYLQQEH